MKDKNMYDYSNSLEHKEIPMLKEELVPYLAHKKQGEYTIDDYYNHTGEHRVELIDGVIYDISSPSTIHQIIISKLWKKFDNYIDSQSGNCIAMFSPMDVQLDCDDKTILQPDIFILCNRDKLKHNVVYGAPDLSPIAHHPFYFIFVFSYYKTVNGCTISAPFTSISDKFSFRYSVISLIKICSRP